MRRGNIFWGGVLILAGGLFLLQAMGLVKDVMGLFWPLGLILLGVWILLERFMFPGWAATENFSIDLGGAAKVALDFDHGAGSVAVSGGAPAGVGMAGVKGTAMDLKSHISGDTLTVDVDAGPTFIPFLGPEGGVWRFQLTEEVPVSMKVNSGASNLDFDFTNVKLAFIGVDTGASSLKIKFPAQAGYTLADIESGAATVELIVPEGVAARVRVEQGASSVNIDQARFPTVNADLYQSPNFNEAANKVEISLEGGASTITVR